MPSIIHLFFILYFIWAPFIGLYTCGKPRKAPNLCQQKLILLFLINICYESKYKIMRHLPKQNINSFGWHPVLKQIMVLQLGSLHLYIPNASGGQDWMWLKLQRMRDICLIEIQVLSQCISCIFSSLSLNFIKDNKEKIVSCENKNIIISLNWCYFWLS